MPLGESTQLGLQALELSGLAAVLHEQNAEAFDGAVVVEVAGTGERDG